MLSLETNDKYSEILDDIFSSSLTNKASESVQKQRKTPKKKSPKKKWDEEPKKPKSVKKKLFKSAQDKENFGTPERSKNETSVKKRLALRDIGNLDEQTRSRSPIQRDLSTPSIQKPLVQENTSKSVPKVHSENLSFCVQDEVLSENCPPFCGEKAHMIRVVMPTKNE